MNSSDSDEIRQPPHYGRSQFFTDVAWMGLDPTDAFSRKHLRQQRDRLMQLHHPDRGGSADMAARINLTYSRMLSWLDRHLEKRNYLRARRTKALAKEATRIPEKTLSPATNKIEKIRLYAAIMGATAAAMGLGLSSLARRKR